MANNRDADIHADLLAKVKFVAAAFDEAVEADDGLSKRVALQMAPFRDQLRNMADHALPRIAPKA
jgi:hypothetical protein